MNMLSDFNQTMDYIETTFDNEVDEKRIATLSGYSYAMFSRIFSILTDTTLNEYIRLRKLTEAARLLSEGKEKVIDIAIKYGYDSPDSFTVAFKNFHGYTPSEVRNGKPYKVFSKMQLTLSIKGGRSMNITIQKKKGFTVAGMKRESIDTSLCAETWSSLFALQAEEELEKMGSGQSYGICFDIKDCNLINYMAAYDVTDIELAKKMNLELMEISDNEYAVVELKGAIPKCIHDGWKYFMEVFCPEHGYIHSGDPDMEVYGFGDMYSPDYKMELWIPIRKTQK